MSQEGRSDARQMPWRFISWDETLARCWTVKQCFCVKLVNFCGRNWRSTERPLHFSARTTVNKTHCAWKVQQIELQSARRDPAGSNTAHQIWEWTTSVAVTSSLNLKLWLVVATRAILQRKLEFPRIMWLVRKVDHKLSTVYSLSWRKVMTYIAWRKKRDVN